MSPNRRIALNIIATYGRSLYALVIGLFCGRWTLMALGEVDYGLIGLVGGLTAFIVFLNGIMASGVGRFYAISVGAAQKDAVAGLEKCREWFTTAVVIHTVLPIVLMAVGYPIGEWVVRHFLTIPPNRIEACVWVWRFTCLNCFVGMASVPYHAMYGAHQEIAELTIYSFVTTTFNVIFLYYVINHPGDWLVRFAIWGSVLCITPSLIITFRAFRKYKECRFIKKYINCWARVKEMMSYSGWLVVGVLGDLLSVQGMAVLINKYFGPRVNAAVNIGNVLSGHCTTLAGSLTEAFWPVMTNAYGAGDYGLVRVYAYRVSRLATFLILIFAIPMALEVDEILVLWLKNPPMYTGGICLCALAVAVIDKTSFGYAIAAHSNGKIGLYISIAGGLFLMALPLAWIFLRSGFSVYWAMIAILLTRSATAFSRVFLAKRLVNTSISYWLFKIVIPLAIISSIGGIAGFLPRLLMAASFMRICVTTFCVEVVLLPLAWRFMFDVNEKEFLYSKLPSWMAKCLKK